MELKLQVVIAVELALILFVLLGGKEKEDPSVAHWRYALEKHLKSIDEHMQMAEKSLQVMHDWYKARGG